MPTIQICVLANSVKNSHRSVAGLEMEKAADGKRKVGGWIRPVSRHDDGALNKDERCLRSWWWKKEPQLLDVLEIDLAKNESDPSHPENWIITPAKPWKLIEKVEWKDVLPYTDRPRDLWLENPREYDRISPHWLRRQQRLQSIYLIKPESVYLEASTEFDQAEGQSKKVRRIVFAYNRFNYRFLLTDPVASERYFKDFPGEKEGVRKINLAGGKDCLLSVSYTPSFRSGYHYKVVEAILESV